MITVVHSGAFWCYLLNLLIQHFEAQKLMNSAKWQQQ